MKIETLQSLIKRNSSRINILEFKVCVCLRGITEGGKLEKSVYINAIRDFKKEIKKLVIIQKELKKEICNHIRYTQHGKNIPVSVYE